jgi:DnaJ-class molecular chaperone
MVFLANMCSVCSGYGVLTVKNIREEVRCFKCNGTGKKE